MNKKDNIIKRLGRFIAGKGFYIVLFLCVAVIGASTWVLVSNTGGEPDTLEAANITASSAPAARPTATDPAATPVATAGIAAESATPAAEDNEAAIDILNEGTENRENPLDNTDESLVDLSKSKPTETAEPAMTQAEQALNASRGNFIWPVSGSIERKYGGADSPVYDKTMKDWRAHKGMDIHVQIGTKVMAAAYGTVESIYSDYWYGTSVVIDHGDGLKSVYSNLAATPTVSVGDTVSAGSYIGSVGSTANAEIGEVAHLHFEILLNEENVDPMEYLP